MNKSALVILLALVAASCGGDGADEGGTPTPTVAVDAEELAEDPEQAAADLAQDLEEVQQAVGGGSATLTVGDQVWTFNSVLCAFGEEQIGQPGAEFNLSAIQDGLQLYVSIDSFGHSVTLDDITDFENPSVQLGAGFAGGNPEEFIVVDGKNVTATASFVDGTTDSFEGIEGTLEATCP